MTVPTTSWDETSPAGSQSIKLGDNRIREKATQTREIIAVDHKMESSGQDSDWGQHKQVTLQEQADLGTGAVGTTILGSQTVSGLGELVYTAETDDDIQITSGTGINATAMTGVYAAANVAAVATIGALLYPVGSIYANASDNTNPGTLLGFGTWVAIEEEALVGYKSGSSEFGSVGSYAGGEKTHTLLEAEMASHTHTTQGYSPAGGGTYPAFYAANTNPTTTRATSSIGSDTAHNNIQPSYVCYMWRRTV